MKNLLLCILGLGLAACGGSEETAVRDDLCVDLYSYGGFSGSAGGVTVTGDGWARFWTGRTAALRATRDSLRLDEETLSRIAALADSGQASSFQFQKAGNLTTVLTIQRRSGVHRLSFAGEQVPGSFPQRFQDLISAMRNLRTTKTEEGR